jgi:hypothetical protein
MLYWFPLEKFSGERQIPDKSKLHFTQVLLYYVCLMLATVCFTNLTTSSTAQSHTVVRVSFSVDFSGQAPKT